MRKLTKTELKRHLMSGRTMFLKGDDPEYIDELKYLSGNFIYINGEDGIPQELDYSLIFDTYKYKEEKENE